MVGCVFRFGRRVTRRTIPVAVVVGAVLAALCVPAAPLLAGDASSGAFLRIETGRHTARVNRLATDAEGRLIATVSNDKTLRLWSRDGGEPLGVLRVPIESGDEGALYAVALSADGSLAVAAGNTGSSWGDGVTLYLFDVKGQRLKARLPGQPHVVNDLAISPDGRFVAGAFGGNAGLRVWDSGNFRLVAEDTAYEARSSALAFAPDGRLATASYDGNIRIYDPGFKQSKPSVKRKAPGGAAPYSVAFSPDGSLLAVGYADALRVDVLSAKDLKLGYSPKTAGLVGGSLAAVAWDGTALVAAGTASPDGTRNVLRRWASGGKGASSDVPLARDSITQLLALPDGGVAFTAADPSWGMVDPSRRAAYARSGDAGDFRDVQQGSFALSEDGLVLDFGLEQGGKRPMRFDVLARSLTEGVETRPGMTRPSAEGRDVIVTDWRNSRAPKVNGHPVTLDAGEWARSVAVLPPGAGGAARVLLGGEFSLRLLDARGAEVARADAPAAVWGVMASADGRLAVAALGDGTLRWYALSGGSKPLEELAALFPHRDGRRWVLWTPEAFFDHSESGGETLVGFHLNDPNKKGTQWLEFKQVYRVFQAPELVRGKLRGTAQAEIDARLAAIGDIRLLNQRRPKIALLEYCAVPRASRGLSLGTGATASAGGADAFPAPINLAPAAPPPAAPPPPVTKSAGSAPDPFPAPLTLAPVGSVPVAQVPTAPAAPPTAAAAPAVAEAAEACLPLDATPVSRAFARAKEPAAPAPAPSVAKEAAAPKGAAPEPPEEEPRVTINLPAGTGSVRIRYRVEDNGGGIGSVDLFRNGRNVSGEEASRGFARAKPAPKAPAAPIVSAPPVAPPASTERASVVRVDAGSNRIQIRAYNGSDAIYERSPMVDFVVPAEAATAAATTERAAPSKPRLITFVVGINAYRPAGAQLRFARADAEAFAATMRQRIPASYDRDQSLALSTTLYDEQASRSAIVAGLEALAAEAREDDTVLLYLAGHGVIQPSAKDPTVKLYHFITQDVTAATADAVNAQALSEKDLNRLVSGIAARNMLVLLDTCHSGAVSAGTVDKLYQDMGGRYLLAASSEEQEALDSYNGRNGIFAHAVLEGLGGKAMLPGDEAIYNLTLGQYVNRAVPRLAKEKQWKQSAIFKTGGNELSPFPLAGAAGGAQ